MTTPNDFIPASNVGVLSTRCRTALLAVSDLMETMKSDLPEPKKAALSTVLDAGGRIGIEFTVNSKGQNQVSLVAIDRDDGRYQLATVKTLHQDIGISH